MCLKKIHFKYLLVGLCFFAFSFAEASTASTTISTNTGTTTATVDMIVNQVVDNSCNENGLCQIELGETTATCPHDCHLSSVTLENLRLMNIGNPIIISGVTFSALSEDQIKIFWNTSKPTSDRLVFVDGMGGTEGGYLDSFFSTEHSIILNNFDINKEYYFKIFSQGTHGDDNFETAKLFALRVANLEDFKNEVIRSEKEDFFRDYDVFIDERTQYLCDTGVEIDGELEKICRIEAPKKERFLDPKRPIYYDNHILYDLGYSLKQILYKLHLLKRGKISMRDYLWIFN